MEPSKSGSILYFIKLALFNIRSCKNSARIGCFIIRWPSLRRNVAALLDFDRLQIPCWILQTIHECFIFQFDLETTLRLIHCLRDLLATKYVLIFKNFFSVWDALRFWFLLVWHLWFASLNVFLIYLEWSTFVAIESRFIIALHALEWLCCQESPLLLLF